MTKLLEFIEEHKRGRGFMLTVIGGVVHLFDGIAIYYGAAPLPPIPDWAPMIGGAPVASAMIGLGIVWMAGGELHGLWREGRGNGGS